MREVTVSRIDGPDVSCVDDPKRSDRGQGANFRWPQTEAPLSNLKLFARIATRKVELLGKGIARTEHLTSTGPIYACASPTTRHLSAAAVVAMSTVFVR